MKSASPELLSALLGKALAARGTLTAVGRRLGAGSSGTKAIEAVPFSPALMGKLPLRKLD